jgi:hypothetical protein
MKKVVIAIAALVSAQVYGQPMYNYAVDSSYHVAYPAYDLQVFEAHRRIFTFDQIKDLDLFLQGKRNKKVVAEFKQLEYNFDLYIPLQEGKNVKIVSFNDSVVESKYKVLEIEKLSDVYELVRAENECGTKIAFVVAPAYEEDKQFVTEVVVLRSIAQGVEVTIGKHYFDIENNE